MTTYRTPAPRDVEPAVEEPDYGEPCGSINWSEVVGELLLLACILLAVAAFCWTVALAIFALIVGV